MSPEDAIAQAKGGQLAPVYLLSGEETYVAETVVKALRGAALSGAFADFNEEKLVAGEVDVGRVLAAVRMAPMMGPRRFVVVRAIERWEGKADDGEEEAAPENPEPGRVSPLDQLAAYAASPAPTACLVLLATKIDGRRKLMAAARKAGWLVPCEPLPRGALPTFVSREARDRGHPVDPSIADLLAEIAGPELSSVVDALERLSLYVGPGQPFTEEAITQCIVRVRESTVWELVNAVGRRDLGTALAALEDVYDPRDRGLRLLGLLAWSVRQLIKFDAAIRAGASPEAAAQKAGAQSFKARELAAQVRRLSPGELDRWILLMSEADLELKGSKRPPRSIVEDTLMQMCRPSAAS